ncbi:MAG TPA: diaminopimelate epimerase [Polyangiaceae bacterium]|nr:diaminopimelate epimerase [Polyangiaceae bacterium]
MRQRNPLRRAPRPSLDPPPASSHPATLTIATDAGNRSCSVVPHGSRDASVDVDMGTIPPPTRVRLDSPAADLLVTSAGNPHAVSFSEITDDVFLSLGPLLSAHPRFPEGINVEFASPIAHDRLRVRVWERGAGPTLACGTGACAAVAAAIHSGRLPHTPEVTVELPGGNLTVSWDPTTGNTRMTGPARRVFEGTAPWPWRLSSPA